MNPEQTFQYIQRLIAEKQARKPVMEDKNTPEHTAKMIVEEAQELVDAVNEAMVTDEVWAVASELADVLYLSLYLCEKCGIDAFSLLETKCTAPGSRNDLKYPEHELQNGVYEDVTARLRQEWKEKGGDKQWTHDLLTSPD